jgi:hypothetical protein
MAPGIAVAGAGGAIEVGCAAASARRDRYLSFLNFRRRIGVHEFHDLFLLCT